MNSPQTMGHFMWYVLRISVSDLNCVYITSIVWRQKCRESYKIFKSSRWPSLLQFECYKKGIKVHENLDLISVLLLLEFVPKCYACKRS